MTTTADLVAAITDMREDDAISYARELIDGGTEPVAILEACREAMDVIGKRFEEGEAFIPELILAGEMLKSVTEAVKPHMKTDDSQEILGKIVLGTVEGDIHDIAKDIVGFMLEINGFEVTDLGVDVPATRFVETARETGAKIVGLSGFLTLAYDPMRDTVAALKEAGLDVKVMVGGGQVDDSIRDYTGADAYGKDAMAAVALAKEWSGTA
jgi:5-methyltetrahydrofolate--homocysteine methyltransferase